MFQTLSQDHGTPSRIFLKQLQDEGIVVIVTHFNYLLGFFYSISFFYCFTLNRSLCDQPQDWPEAPLFLPVVWLVFSPWSHDLSLSHTLSLDSLSEFTLSWSQLPLATGRRPSPFPRAFSISISAFVQSLLSHPHFCMFQYFSLSLISLNFSLSLLIPTSSITPTLGSKYDT